MRRDFNLITLQPAEKTICIYASTQVTFFASAGVAAKCFGSSLQVPFWAIAAGEGLGTIGLLAYHRLNPLKFGQLRRKVDHIQRSCSNLALTSILLAVTLNRISAKLSGPMGFIAGVYLAMRLCSICLGRRAVECNYKLAGM